MIEFNIKESIFKKSPDYNRDEEKKMKTKERFKAMSLKKKIAVILVNVFLYVNIGHIYAYSLAYADYYPASWVAKVLAPIPQGTIPNASPFNPKKPSINKKLATKFGSFKGYFSYLKSPPPRGSNFYWVYFLFWPALVVFFYTVSFALWAFVLLKFLIVILFTGSWINVLLI